MAALMKKSRFSEQQIIKTLNLADAGVKEQGLCRQLGKLFILLSSPWQRPSVSLNADRLTTS
jgi:hypothetical protein